MANEDARKLFVAGLPDSITEDVLRQLFEATGGTVSEISLPKDRATGRPRGFGFVTLATSEEAQAARDSLDGTLQAGKSISVRPFQAEPPKREAGQGAGRSPSAVGPQSAPDRTLYVGNLPYDVTQAEVEELVAGTNAGPIARVHLPADPDGRKRGFGFVTMEAAEGARGAIEALRGAELRGRRLVINLAHPKGDRPPRRDQDFGGGGFGGGGAHAAPAAAGPPPERRTFDQRRRGGGAVAGPTREAEGAARKRKWEKERDGGRGGKHWDDDED
jgi:RNA recognition motif-containing protein